MTDSTSIGALRSTLFLSPDPGPMWSLVVMPDGTAFEGAGSDVDEAEADARARWKAWKTADGGAKPVADPPCRVYWGSHLITPGLPGEPQ